MNATAYRICLALVAAATSLLAPATAASAAELPTSSLSLVLGQKELDDSDWDAVESQVEWGIVADLGRSDSVVNLVVSYFSSSDDSSSGGRDFSGESWELGLGIRKSFRVTPAVAPYLEVGAALVDATLEQQNEGGDTEKESDGAFGAWGGAGVNFAVGERLMVGLSVRYTSAEATLLGEDRAVGGLHYGISAGLGF